MANKEDKTEKLTETQELQNYAMGLCPYDGEEMILLDDTWEGKEYYCPKEDILREFRTDRIFREKHFMANWLQALIAVTLLGTFGCMMVGIISGSPELTILGTGLFITTFYSVMKSPAIVIETEQRVLKVIRTTDNKDNYIMDLLKNKPKGWVDRLKKFKYPDNEIRKAILEQHDL